MVYFLKYNNILLSQKQQGGILLQTKRTSKLDPRLEKVACFVRPCAIFADIGCDHGYLAIELIRRGADHGFACDISSGPLACAQRHIELAGLSSKIQIKLTDGLQGLENCGLTDITIAGMGGEVIAGILQRAEFTKSPSLRLILQPQSREFLLRRFLAENGFALIQEEAVRAGRYVYTVIVAEYDGIPRQLSTLESYCGLLFHSTTPEAREKLQRTAGFLKETSNGLFHRGKAAEAQELAQTAEQILLILDQNDSTFPKQ